MTRRQKARDEEEKAAEWVAAALGGASISRYDTGSAPSQYDFALLLPSGQRIALDITSAGSERRALPAALARYGDVLMGDGLESTWAVAIRPDAVVKDLAPALVAFLHEHEAAGGGRLNLEQDMSAATEAIRVAGVLQLSPDVDASGIVPQGSRISVGILGRSSDSFISQIGEEMAKSDNLLKLGAADCERHLFIRVDDPSVSVQLVRQDPLPACPADAAGVIDAVWVWGIWSGDELLGAVPGAAWQRYKIH